jgi:2-polyprenyl-6-methoxyphenol hydroxylase-like FAD-dependent oxidoreductase
VAGSLLVGADGVGSKLRQKLNPDQGPTKTYAGYLGVGLIIGDETKVEMTLHHYPGHQVGVASCGRVNEVALRKSIFMWTHIRMPESDAKLATRASVEAELARRASRWNPELRSKYELYSNDADAILAYGPIYNGKPPDRWYSNRMILIGDAAHPYGPGGQGFTEDDKREFQQSRSHESRALGEAAEKRNARAASSTKWRVFGEGLGVKAMEIFTRGKLSF